MHRARLTLGVAVALISQGCTADSDEPPQNTAGAAPDVVLLASANDAFEAPDTIHAGWTTFQFANNGDDIHYAHFVKLAPGKTASELIAAYAEAIRTSAPRPEWMTRFGGPGGAVPGGSSAATQYMEPGNYVLLCPVEDSTGNPHFVRGEHRTVVVRASAIDASARKAPSATATIRLMDFGFSVDSQMTAGTHTIRTSNAGVEGHDLVIMRLAQGITLDDVSRTMNPEAARRTGSSAKPAVPFENLGTLVGGIAVIHSGMDVFFTVTLTPGDYALLCMTTAGDGRSHIEHGMIQLMAVKQ